MELVRQGHSEAAALRKLGMARAATTVWKRNNVFNYKERLKAARDESLRRLSSRTREAFPDEDKPAWAKAFLEEFKRSGEQIKACRFAGITYRQLRAFSDPESKDCHWWFAGEFNDLLAEQRQEIKDSLIAKKDSPSLLQFLVKNEEILGQKPKREEAADEVSDSAIIEALSAIAEKINGPSSLPPN